MEHDEILDAATAELEGITPPENDSDFLRKKTLSGMKWVFFSSFGQRAISFITTIFLARLLAPADFGLFALAFVMIDGFGLFKSFGFDSALLRRKGEVQEAADTAFVLIPIFGLTLFILLYLLAPYGASLLGSPQVTPIVRTLSLIFVFTTLTQVPSVLIQKRLDFQKRAIPEVVSSLAFSILAIPLALMGLGVWSLVYAYLFKTILFMGMTWSFARWRPRFRFQPRLAKEMFHFGKFIFLGSILFFIRQNLDHLLVGKVIGIAALGYYSIAFNLATFPSKHITGRMHSVLFPVFSRIQGDPSTLKRAFLKSFKMISLFALPFGFFLFLVSPAFLRVVYGEKWLPAAGALRILAFAGLFRACQGVMGPVFLAEGKSRLNFFVNAIQAGLFFILVIPMTMRFGLLGAGSVVLFSSAVSFLVATARIKKLLHLSQKEILLAWRPALIGSALTVFVFGLLAMGRSLVWSLSAPISTGGFIFITALACLTYLFSIFLLDRDVRLELRRIV